MKTKTSFAELFQAARNTSEYEVEGAILEFTEQVIERMGSNGVNRAALAEKLDTSPAYVTKILKGSSNLTIESMVKLSTALDSEIRIQLIPKIKPKTGTEFFAKNGKASNTDRTKRQSR